MQNDAELKELLDKARPLLPWSERWAGLGEEGAELCQAALKMRRVITQINRTPVTADQAAEDVAEEIADVFNFLDLLEIRDDDAMMERVNEIRKFKLRRMASVRFAE